MIPFKSICSTTSCSCWRFSIFFNRISMALILAGKNGKRKVHKLFYWDIYSVFFNYLSYFVYRAWIFDAQVRAILQGGKKKKRKKLLVHQEIPSKNKIPFLTTSGETALNKYNQYFDPRIFLSTLSFFLRIFYFFVYLVLPRDALPDISAMANPC